MKMYKVNLKDHQNKLNQQQKHIKLTKDIEIAINSSRAQNFQHLLRPDLSALSCDKELEAITSGEAWCTSKLNCMIEMKISVETLETEICESNYNFHGKSNSGADDAVAIVP